jgi:hypothetical protein
LYSLIRKYELIGLHWHDDLSKYNLWHVGILKSLLKQRRCYKNSVIGHE